MKRSEQGVPGAMTGAVNTDDGFKSNSHKQSIQWKNKGGRNATTEEARHEKSSPLAPIPRTSGAQMLGSSKFTAPVQGSIARVKAGGSAPTAGSFLPVQNNAMANLKGTSSPVPHGAPAPVVGSGAPGIRAGGRNQMWPNAKSGMYTDGAKLGGSGKDAGPIATRIPKRRGKGAAFFGEYA